MEPLVVLPVGADELVGARLVECSHLLEEPRSADRGEDSLVRYLAPEHGPRGVLERGEDHPARVDQGAVEVEEDDRKPHQAMVSSGSTTPAVPRPMPTATVRKSSQDRHEPVTIAAQSRR